MRSDLAELQAAIEGEVVLPASLGYAAARKAWSARFHDAKPVAIVRCRTPADVAGVLALARRRGMEIAVRSGGHCLAGRSSTDGLLIDVSPMSSISVSDGRATVGAGARLGDVDETLAACGRAIAAGSCPTVGIAGLTLGGGLGVLGRRHGLTSDQLIEAQVVLADGRIVDCDERRHEDLFWALRGAGAGQLGVVTRFVFKTVAAEPLTCFKLVWRHEHAGDVADAWQHWAPDAADELAASLLLNAPADPNSRPRVTVFGAMLGGADDAEANLDELVVRARLDPESTTIERMPHRAAKDYLFKHAPGAEQSEPTGQPEPGALFIKSGFFRRMLPRATIDALVARFAANRTSGEARELDFTPWGGAYNRSDPRATAFAHRDERFLLKHAVTIDPAAPAQAHDAGRDWLARSWALVQPLESGGVFPNFPDPDLAHSARAYYGDNQARLMSVKSRYDPGHLFRLAPHSVAPGPPPVAPP